MKKFLSFLLIFLLSITTFSSPLSVFADSKDVSISSPNSVVLDYDTGKVLYEKNGNKKVYPASTTKIWTAYLVIKNVKNLDAPVEIDKDLYVDGSSMYLEKGEIFTVRELLQGLLIHSSNDAAEVLADAFNLKDIHQGIYLDGVVSRKKQMLPPILETLERRG